MDHRWRPRLLRKKAGEVVQAVVPFPASEFDNTTLLALAEDPGRTTADIWSTLSSYTSRWFRRLRVLSASIRAVY
jgi:hypothetical protein